MPRIGWSPLGRVEEQGTIQIRTVAGRGMWLFSLRHLLTQTIDILFQHKWTILECPGTMKWVTSDDPVIKLNARSATDYDFKGGWGSRGTEIFMPLGPKHFNVLVSNMLIVTYLPCMPILTWKFGDLGT